MNASIQVKKGSQGEFRPWKAAGKKGCASPNKKNKLNRLASKGGDDPKKLGEENQLWTEKKAQQLKRAVWPKNPNGGGKKKKKDLMVTLEGDTQGAASF